MTGQACIKHCHCTYFRYTVFKIFNILKRFYDYCFSKAIKGLKEVESFKNMLKFSKKVYLTYFTFVHN